VSAQAWRRHCGPANTHAPPARCPPELNRAAPATSPHTGSRPDLAGNHVAAGGECFADEGAGLTARISALRQLVLQVPAPVIADALGFHHTTATRQHVKAGGPWSQYASGDREP